MPGRFFIDTNVLVYSFDVGETRKRRLAQDMIGTSLASGDGIISHQVVQEFLNVATSKFAKPLRIEDSKEYLDTVLMPLCRVYPDVELYHAALDLKARFGYGFYDSLILAAALQAGCSVLYSEDLQDGQTVRDLTIRNPFA